MDEPKTGLLGMPGATLYYKAGPLECRHPIPVAAM